MPQAKIDESCELFYDIHDFSDPWQESEVVLLHHAAAGSVSRWHHWVPRLARHFKVVRFDARGHDRSTVPPPDHRWNIQSMAEDVDKLLTVLDIDQVHYIGASAGGIIGQQFAAGCSGPWAFSPPSMSVSTLVWGGSWRKPKL